MKFEAKCQRRNLRARIAGILWTILAAVAVMATGGSTALAAMVSAPTGATLPWGAPVLVLWTPSYWPSTTVDIGLYRVSPSPVWLGPLATNVNNNGGAYVNLPQSLVCEPTYVYRMLVRYPFGTPNNVGYNQYSADFKLSCGGSITVVKTVINDSGGPIPNGSFPVDVTCGHGGPNTTLALSSANGFQDSVMNIPLGSHCTVSEQAPKAPKGCRWSTTYPQGQSVVIGNAGYRREVRNRLTCGSISSGTLTVLKQVINGSSSVPPPNVPFQVQVTCSTSGPNVPVTLSAANNFTQAVGNIPANSVCMISEHAPTVPPDLAKLGCSWEPSYPAGNKATIANAAAISRRAPALQRMVVNRWTCKETAAACCTPDWNSVPASSYNNPAVIAACSATTQAQCVSNAAIHCLWDTQSPNCSGAPAVSCAASVHVPPYNIGSNSANNVPIGQCYKNTGGECLYNWRAPGTYNDGLGWITGCPANVSGDNCCGWSGSSGRCCTQQLPNNNANCSDISCNPPSPSAEANCLAVGNHSAQKGCDWNPKCGGDTVLGCCLQKDPKTASFVGCPGFPAGGGMSRCKAPCQWNPLDDPKCGSGPSATLTILKQVINGSSSVPPPNVPFQVQVTCSTSGPNVPVTLSAANNFTQAVGNIPVNSVCTISEHAPAVPPNLAKLGCGWDTSYPDGKEVTIVNAFTTLQRTVVNRWTCTETAAACCTPDWNSVPASSYNNPAVIAACSASTQAQCVSNAAIHCLWDTQNPKCSGATTSDPAQTGIANPASDRLPAPEFEAAAKQALQDLAEAYNAKRRSAFIRLLSEDFVGDQSALEEDLANDFRNYSSVNLALTPNHVDLQGTSAAVEFNYNLTMVSTQGDNSKFSGRSNYVFHKEEDGKVRLYKMEKPGLFGKPLPPSGNPMSPTTKSSPGQSSLGGDASAPGVQNALNGLSAIGSGSITEGGPSRPGSGFKFDTQSNVPESSADIRNQGGDIKVSPGSAIVSIGSCKLDSVAALPARVNGSSAEAEVGECYAVRTAANKFAVLRVSSTGGTAAGGSTIRFDFRWTPVIPGL